MQVDAATRTKTRRASKHKSLQRKASRIYSNPYLNFIRDFRRDMQGKDMSPTQITSLAGRRWREMSQEERRPYIELAAKAKRAGVNKRGKRVKRRKEKKGRRGRRRRSGLYDAEAPCNYCRPVHHTRDLPRQMSGHTSASSFSRSPSRTSYTSDGSDR